MENMLKKPADSESPSSMGDDSAGRVEGRKQNHVDDVEMGFVSPDNSVQIKRSMLMTRLIRNTRMS